MTFPRILAAAAVAATLTLTGCSTPASQSTTPAASGQQATASYRTLDATAFAALVQQPGTVVLDVRTPAEYAAGHLAEAVNIDVNAADFPTRIAGLDKAVTYAVYCRSGNRSAAALEAMKAAGFTRADHLGGGIGAWQSAGLPVVS